MTSYIVSAFSKIGMMAAVVAASLFPTSLSAQDVAGAADAAELALAGETPVLDSGNTAWLIVATVLVLLMSIPGIALFYGGLVRQKNVLSVIMQTMFIVGVVSILWVAFGYSWAFGTGFMESGNPLGAVIGGFDKAFLYGITIDTMMPSGIPELTFVMFQCMFALITPALIRATRCLSCCGSFWPISRWRTGCGEAASCSGWVRSISLAERWFISMPVSRPWLWRSCWEKGKITGSDIPLFRIT